LRPPAGSGDPGYIEETKGMSTAYNVHEPDDRVQASWNRGDNWAETTLRSVAVSIEDYARENPLSFAAWTFGIGFILGWKLKPW
jgi:hypothetical protein